ncbi:DUF3237 domain-containing protein [Pseudomonas lopnurensis]|uniref:DUF3237 domain-containing protein n=1 Tax=Pseudomonas lopnurensis TaxID=1477517 RepID=UPI0028ACE896|nr:DUF3237 domain-containing protein [Pseudomonas lopnurensis]
MSINLTLLAIATLELETPTYIANGPRGTRVIAEIRNASWEGERLNAKQKGNAAADWALVGADGTLAIDVRTTLETDDGAIIFVSYEGRAQMTQNGASPLIITPRFETGDDRYKWLNKVQAIGRGSRDEQGRLVYKIYEAK